MGNLRKASGLIPEPSKLNCRKKPLIPTKLLEILSCQKISLIKAVGKEEELIELAELPFSKTVLMIVCEWENHEAN